MAKNDWVLYIVEAENGAFYTGITNDLSRRLQQHQTGNGGAKFFHTSQFKQLVYQESHADRSSASIREAALKKLTHRQKRALINNAV